MSLPRRVPIRMTESEYQRWLLVADGAPLATWARVVVNTHVREVLGSFGEGDTALAAAADPSPSPKERGRPLIEVLGDPPLNEIDRLATGESFTSEKLGESLAEYEQHFGPLEDRADELGLEENCPQAPQHWQIPRGESCPTCGGVAR